MVGSLLWNKKHNWGMKEVRMVSFVALLDYTAVTYLDAGGGD